MIRMIRQSAGVAPSAGECADDINGRPGGQRSLPVIVPHVLEARFIHDLRPEDLRVADLQGLFRRHGVVAGGRQGKLSDARIVLRVVEVLVAGGERVVRAELVVEARAEIGSRSRIRHAFAELHRVQIWIEHNGIHYRQLIDVSPLDIEKERCFLVQRPADVSHVDGRVIRRFFS